MALLCYNQPEQRTIPMVKKSIDAKVRPLANASLEKASLLGAARIYVNKDSIIALTGTLDSGSACIVEKFGVDGPDGAAPSPIRREASLCVLPDKGVSLNVVMMSRAFQDAAGFKIGDQVRISLAEAPTPDAEEVVVRDISEGSQEDKDTRYAPSWEHSISLSLGAFYLPPLWSPSLTIDRTTQREPNKCFPGWS